MLYQRSFPINANISVCIPTVGEVLAQEDEYNSMVSLLTAMPMDLMVQLDDIGVDFEKINEYELFLLVFNTIREMDTSLIFGDLDLTHFSPVINPAANMIVLRDPESGIVIDQAAQTMIATVLRKIHGLEKNIKRPANKEARDYLMKREREKMKRRSRRKTESALEQYIVALVNTAQFPYDFESVKNLSIYQFNESLRQIVRKDDIDHRLNGIYAGTLDAKKISSSDLNWLIRK